LKIIPGHPFFYLINLINHGVPSPDSSQGAKKTHFKSGNDFIRALLGHDRLDVNGIPLRSGAL
jgi:hypothetical protein